MRALQAQQQAAALQAQRDKIPQDDRRALDQDRAAHDLVGRIGNAHAQLFDPKSNKVSDALSAAMASSSKANTAAGLFIPEGAAQGEKERAFAAEYNNVMSRLYDLTKERQLSEQDAVRNLKSFVPGVSPSQFQANLKARIQSYENSFDRRTKGLQDQGYSTKGYESIRRAEGGGQPGQSAAPSKKIIQRAKDRVTGKEIVRYEGSAPDDWSLPE